MMDEVAQTGQELAVSKNGRPVVRVLPYRVKLKTLFVIDKGYALNALQRCQRPKASRASM